MNAIYVAIAAAMIIAGIFVALGGFLPSVAGHDLSLSSRASRRWGGIPRPMRWRLAVGITAGIVVLAFTGFIPALLLVPANSPYGTLTDLRSRCSRPWIAGSGC